MNQYLTTRTCKLDANGNGIDICEGVVIIFESMAGATVKLTWLDPGGQESGSIAAAVVGRKYNAGGIFEGLKFSGGQANDLITYLVGPSGADSYNILAAAAVIGHVVVDNEVEVKNDAGNALSCKETLGTLVTDNAAVVVNQVLTAVLALDATRREVRIGNQGPNAVAIGGAGLTWAKRSVVLQPGDVHIERAAPGAVFNAITDVAPNNVASVGVQVVT